MKSKMLKLMCPLILVAAIAVNGILTTVADIPIYSDTIDLKNPKMNFKVIDTEPYSNGTWSAEGNFEQTDTETDNAKYTISSNAYVAWFEEDDIAFAYNQFNIGESSTDTLDYSMTVHSHKPITAGYDSVPENGSVGIMMRDSLNGNGAMVFMHIRPEAIMMVYRMKSGNQNSSAIYTSIPEQYPVEIRLERKGKLFTGYYRQVGANSWFKVGSCSALFNGPTYAGIATHSCKEEVTTQSVVTDVIIKGNGTWTGGGDSPGSGGSSGTSSGDTSSIEPGPEDAPIDDNVLLKETFSDGTLKTPESNDGVFEIAEVEEGGKTVKKRVLTNPVWNNPSCENIVTLEDGNRVLFKDYADGYDFIGDTNWTDYKASFDFQFTEFCNMQDDNKLRFLVRHISQEMYGCFDYDIRIENYSLVSSSGNALYDELGNRLRGMRIVLYRRQRVGYSTLTNTYSGGVELATCNIDNIMGDGLFHNLSVSAVDNHLIISLDGSEVIDYTDDNYLCNLTGGIGIITSDTSVYIDNIVVEKIEDPLGGDYDNYIGGRFNEPTPEYIGDMEIPYYDFTTPNSNGTIERVE